ncbi:MAG: hypothetical protein JNM93_06465, partial [Bacteriovoracaceae bacterium]|nr:hypothetical protein [Bacteriovoracaceae bacterium]
MNRIAFYVLLILVYLGLAKSFSSNELGIAYLKNASGLSKIVKGNNVTAILVDMHATGFIIKTYYQKYRLVYPFEKTKEIIVRVSRKFAHECKDFIGLSLFRRLEKESLENTTPLPPGSLFVGNTSFGRWKQLNSGHQGWVFFMAYSAIPRELGWLDFQPNTEFVDSLQTHLGQNKPFL